jgi:membrane protease YdiL (CAAX protease family)
MFTSQRWLLDRRGPTGRQERVFATAGVGLAEKLPAAESDLVPSPAFNAYVAPARPSCALWRTLFGIALIIAIYAASFSVALGTVVAILGPDAAYGLAASLISPETPRATLFLLATFLGMAAAPMAVVRMVHKRSPATLFGRAPRVLRDFVLCASVVGAFYAVTVGIWSLVYDAAPGVPLGTWVALLPLTLVGILLQTGAEELVFRGYLMQQLAARFSPRVVWLLVPSLLFGLVHYAPAMTGSNAWILVVGASLFGLLAADLTATTGSIGASWGFHFANNLLALAILATDGTITGLALYLTPYAADAEGPAQIALLADYALLVIAWALCRAVVRR